ncbi:MAG: N-acetyltransferase family protein [Haliscomenobacter sp.]
MSNLSIQELRHRADLKEFIALPARVHAGHSNWLPPLYMDEWVFFDPKKNKAFAQCDTLLLLARREGTVVGRIMGIIHHPYNERVGERTVRFSHLEAFEDEEAVHALIQAVEGWGQEKGMNRSVGPFGFSDKDPEGLMVEGFEQAPILVTTCNLPYLPEMVERAGYSKKLDCLDFLIDIERGIPASFPRIFERVHANPAFRLVEFNQTKEIKPYIEAVFQLINIAYIDLYGFQPMDAQEIQELASRYLPLLNPRFVKVVLDAEEQLIAFVIGMPNLAPGIQRAKGKLLPVGWWHILKAMRQATRLDLMLGAVHPDYRGRGLDVLMGWPLIQSARQKGIRTFETHLVLETNARMLAEYARLGATLHKRFRVFQRDL